MHLIWSSAGGSIKTDPAGVWWASMPFPERINYAAFVNNQKQIESKWDSTFGDRKIELVFIGQNLDVNLITNQLEMFIKRRGAITVGEWRIHQN